MRQYIQNQVVTIQLPVIRYNIAYMWNLKLEEAWRHKSAIGFDFSKMVTVKPKHWSEFTPGHVIDKHRAVWHSLRISEEFEESAQITSGRAIEQEESQFVERQVIEHIFLQF